MKNYWLIIILIISSLFCCSLIGVRNMYLGIDITSVQNMADLKQLKSTTTFLFLIWNLFLAWVQYWVSLLLKPGWNMKHKKMITGFLLLLWLAFFPNAPYILTDLLHLRHRAPIPFWYDLMVFISFAWTGLILGYASLFEVEKFIQKRTSTLFSRLFCVLSIALCGFGIYLGRVLRWNSWDIICQPFALSRDIFENLINPAASSYTIGLALLISVFLLLGYFTLISFKNEENTSYKS